jgi:hypothetical protein
MAGKKRNEQDDAFDAALAAAIVGSGGIQRDANGNAKKKMTTVDAFEDHHLLGPMIFTGTHQEAENQGDPKTLDLGEDLLITLSLRCKWRWICMASRRTASGRRSRASTTMPLSRRLFSCWPTMPQRPIEFCRMGSLRSNMSRCNTVIMRPVAAWTRLLRHWCARDSVTLSMRPCKPPGWMEQRTKCSRKGDLPHAKNKVNQPIAGPWHV